jgi:hypothetical protein
LGRKEDAAREWAEAQRLGQGPEEE